MGKDIVAQKEADAVYSETIHTDHRRIQDLGSPRRESQAEKERAAQLFSPNAYNRSFSILRSSTSNTDNTQSTWMYHKIPRKDHDQIPDRLRHFLPTTGQNTWLNAMLKYPVSTRTRTGRSSRAPEAFSFFPARNSRSVCPSR